MARYERTYAGEKRTEGVRLMLTPSERDELEAAAEGQGAPTLSAFARELLFRRSAAVVAATRRNPEAKAIMQALDAAAFELSAIGNNLNHTSRHLNSTGELRDWGERLRDALASFERGEAQHIAAVSRVLDL
jgi:xanthine/CO dehydrogenase XdhC/CoxF family maturation factor